MTTKSSLLIQHANLLGPDEWLKNTSLFVQGGCIVALADAAERAAQNVSEKELSIIDASGRWIFPGIIDLHGDAFERDITPRAGTYFPLELAMAANDSNLIANGITTFFYSITDGFEPGPRSRDTVRNLLNVLEKMAPRFACQARVHIRHEKVNTQKHEELLDWLASGRIHLLSLNDHLPLLDNPAKIERYLAGLRRRVPMSEEETKQFLAGLQNNRSLGENQTLELVEEAQKHNIPLASHDDETIADIVRNQTFGTHIAEFPLCEKVASAARKAGISVLMGAPNLVRGGSHVGAISVKDALESGLVDILCSDYHYPSLFHAPFLAERQGLLSLPLAWKLVSEHPAKAAGLGQQKGRIAPGYDADLLILNSLDGLPTSIERTLIKGKEVFCRGNALE
ncbi:MAG: alpha-D-ribose 1-methylphosphonate 5-triphosphate diphosphatase [Oleiphilaceae bacterium]|jgi:alpha-D-ribose 1-methylphosphonate 5-triphosphate diphosphatase